MEKKRKHKVAYVKKPSAESAENSSTLCLALGPVNVFSESHKRNETLSKFKTHFIPLQEHILP